MITTFQYVMAAIATVLGTVAHATPPEFVDACYVRAEPPPPASGNASGPTQSHLGLRRKGTQLVEVSVAVVGANGAVCSVAGIAKIQGNPGAQYLSLVIRPDGGGPSGKVPCQLRIQESPAHLELTTTEPSCQAQSLCEGQVRLSGQRFELAARVPQGTKGPCFASSSAPT